MMEEAVTAGGAANRGTDRGNSSVASSSTRTMPEAGKISCRNKARTLNSCLQGAFGMCSQQKTAKAWEKVC